MWEMLTGKVPWDGLSVADMKARVMIESPALSRLAYFIYSFPFCPLCRMLLVLYDFLLLNSCPHLPFIILSC